MIRTLIRIKRAIPLFDYPVRGKYQCAPFFIVGSGRSGNTLLRRILCNHPGIHIPPETYVLKDIIQTYSYNKNLYWPDLVVLCLSKFQFHPEFSCFEIDLNDLIQKLSAIPRDRRSLATILDEFYLYHAQKVSNKSGVMWGDKTPYNTFAVNEIKIVFPDAKFIHLIRDGCDVVASYLTSGIYTDPVAAAERWALSESILKEFSKKHGKSVLNVRYEELVRAPEKLLKQVCEFIGIAFNSNMLDMNTSQNKLGDVEKYKHHENVHKAKAISSSSIGKGRKSLEPSTISEIEDILNPTLLQLGYPKCG